MFKEWLSRLVWPITAPIIFIQNHFKATVFVVIVLALIIPHDEEGLTHPNLAKVYLEGAIFSSHETVQRLRELEKNENIKGILLIVDSPGGAVAPSVEIAAEIKRVSQKKPIIAYAGGTMASGSYYASIWTKKIIANPGSDIGSIGVIFESPNVSKLMEKVGVSANVIKAGKYKEVGTPTREWTQDEKTHLQNLIDDTYDMFVGDVSHARRLDKNRSSEFADAKIFTARQALKIGLVDKIGVLSDAEYELQQMSHVKDPLWEEKSQMDKFFEKLETQTHSLIVNMVSGNKQF